MKITLVSLGIMVCLSILIAQMPGITETVVLSIGQSGSDSLLLHPRRSFEIIDMKNRNDTLHINAGSWDWDYPFGRFKRFNDIKKTQFGVSIKSRSVKLYIEVPITHSIDSTKRDLVYQIDDGESFVKFDKNEDDGLFYIVYGKIMDSKIVLRSGIHVGMSEQDFLRKYFKSFPSSILPSLHVIEIESPVVGTMHRYVFKDGILEIIELEAGDLMLGKYTKF